MTGPKGSIQAATVAALDALSCAPRWIVDATPLPVEAHEPCENDWAHGPATVYGGPCNGLCLACAVQAIIREHRDPAGSDHMVLSVLLERPRGDDGTL
jgi:hypothetical protein